MTEIGRPLENPERDVQPVYDPVPREVEFPEVDEGEREREKVRVGDREGEEVGVEVAASAR